MFEKILDAYQKGDIDLFTARVRNWLDAESPCPFESGSIEQGLYAKAVLAHKRWRAKGIASRYAKVQMVDYVRQIAELQKNKNIAEDENKKNKKAPTKVKEVKLDESVHITGVIPEEMIVNEDYAEDEEI